MPNRLRLDDFPNTRAVLRNIKELQTRSALELQMVNGFKAYPVGSYETTDQAYEDIDILLYTNIYDPTDYFMRHGWRVDPNYENGRSFKARLDGNNDTNIIWTSDPVVFDKFYKAANLCKKLNLTKKEDRILVHEMFMNRKLPKTIDELQV